jgi:hypothetical protein
MYKVCIVLHQELTMIMYKVYIVLHQELTMIMYKVYIVNGSLHCFLYIIF